MPLSGALLCLASAVAFGAMGIFGKLAYDDGVTVGTLLAVRFAVAAALFWVLVFAVGGGRRALRALPAREVALALALGAVAYSAQAGAYFAALDRLDASLLSLVLYTFPAMVAVAAILLKREPARSRTFWALALSSAGLVLVLAGAGAGALDGAGVALGLLAAVIYTGYILTSAGVASRVAPLALSALVCTGAAVTLSLGALATGDLAVGSLSVASWGWLLAIASVSTVGAVTLFFAGLGRVGPTAASILSTAEPVTAVALAVAIFGDPFGVVQVVGAALVVGAVFVLSAPARRRRRAAGPPVAPAPAEAAA